MRSLNPRSCTRLSHTHFLMGHGATHLCASATTRGRTQKADCASLLTVSSAYTCAARHHGCLALAACSKLNTERCKTARMRAVMLQAAHHTFSMERRRHSRRARSNCVISLMSGLHRSFRPQARPTCARPLMCVLADKAVTGWYTTPAWDALRNAISTRFHALIDAPESDSGSSTDE